MAVREITKGTAKFLIEDTTYGSHFWDRFGDWENDTCAAFDLCIRPTTTYVDIGAWIGPTTLYAGTTAKRCIAFEPDPVAFPWFCQNLLLNPAIRAKTLALNAALWTRDGLIQIASSSLGNSESSLVISGQRSSPVACLDVAHALPEIVGPDEDVFLKVDVEGAEYEVIPRMADFLRKVRPSIWLSFHPQNICKGQDERQAFLERRAKSLNLLSTLSFYKNIYVDSGGKMIAVKDWDAYFTYHFTHGGGYAHNLLFSDKEDMAV